ncbi:MAG: twin-arginine translocation signal domain-containing protein, partial [Opitutaceae bacterium]|nr:twin-arginine translocation signal domain-containing protein [Opitutaceae bacterium]
MHPFESCSQAITRRTFLGRSATGIGSLALASLLNPNLLRA